MPSTKNPAAVIIPVPMTSSCFRAVLRAEAEALLKVADAIHESCITRAIQMLAACEGKVVVTGLGKSGIVGHKIAATLTSTGTPAQFLHASDAMHGDLGIVCERDVAILISQSGESEDIVALTPHFRSRRVPMIALVGNVESTLARTVDVALSTAVDREACPLNLAPTASTAVALAMGDALAIELMQIRGFTSEDFARNHPSGRLGKRLTLRVGDIMHAGSTNPRLPPTAPWTDVIEALCRHSLGAVNIVDSAGSLLGLITDGDVRRAVQRTPDGRFHQLNASNMMTMTPTTVYPDILAYDALRLMEDRPSQISVLPVEARDSKVCLGLLRLHDILRSGIT